MRKKQTSHTIDISVPVEEMETFKEAAFEGFRKELDLPGFRKGTVSADVAKKHIDDTVVFADAVERAISKKATEAVEEMRDRVVGRPDVQVKKATPGNPLEFTVEMQLLPEVDVTEWRQLRIPFNPKEVTETDVEESLEQLRKSRVRTAAVNRAAREGDQVVIDFSTRIEGVKVEGGESKNHPVILGDSGFVPGFDDAIIGMQKGEQKTFTLPFPKDWPMKKFAGKKAEYTITLNNVMERTLPELNDEFAKTLGNFQTLDELKANVRKGLMMEREMEEKQRVRQEAVKQMGSAIKEREIPDMVLEQELERMKHEFEQRIQQQGLSMEKYLEHIGKKEEDLTKDWQEGALDRVRATLIIRAIADHEDVSADPKEVDQRTKQLLKQYTPPGDEGPRLDSDAVRSYTEATIVNEMTLDIIESVVTQEK